MKVITPYCPHCLDQTEDPPLDLETLKSVECPCPVCQENPWMDMHPACHPTSRLLSQFCPVHGVVTLVCSHCYTYVFTLAIAQHHDGFPRQAKRRPSAPDSKSGLEPIPRSDPGGRAA